MLSLSVLDLSFVTSGSTYAGPEEHARSRRSRTGSDTPVLGGRAPPTCHPSPAAPDIMIGQIAAVTERIRVGSGA